ncbi:hypothetical protein GC194_04735 [bacterium]|nr:hypothetical protein [bacterium]
MAVAIWSYPFEETFKIATGELLWHHSWATVSAYPAFVVAPFNTQHGIYTLDTNGADTLSDSADVLRKCNLHLHEMVDESKPAPFTQLVQEAVEAMNLDPHTLQKVVLSRYKDIPLAHFGFDWLNRLRKKYPNAFVALVSDKAFGTWITASPELFVARQYHHFTSYSLAGTKYGANLQLGQKENHEQSIVTEYIINAFRHSGLQVGVNSQVEMPAGNLTHLLTEVSGVSKVGNNPNLQLINDLHPTPAVGGFPKSEALEFIKKENYNRQLYTGFLGEYRHPEHFRFFVNLRSAQLFKNAIRFYAGAGITRYSVPQKELLETEAKMQVLMSVLLS